MAQPRIEYVGDGYYRVVFPAEKGKGEYATRIKAAPGTTITVRGVKMVVPAPPPVNPGTPYLEADEMLQFNNQLNTLAGSEIDLNAAIQNSAVNYERTIADLARNALISTQALEENMAARGQYDSGLRSGGLTDIQATKALQESRAAEDLRNANALYELKRNTINSARADLQNWYTLTAGKNAGKTSLPPLPNMPGGKIGTSPGNTGPGSNTALPPSGKSIPKVPAYPGGPASGAAYQARLPASATHAGVPVPATTAGGGTYASGPAPGKNYKWNGVRWVKV